MKPHFAFFGTPEFAAIVLDKLTADGFVPNTVVCNPDRPVGRKKILTPAPTKVIAQRFGIKVWQPDKLAIANYESPISNMDFSVVAAYAKIIPKKILGLPRLGAIGVHPSLLPKYRGPSPIQSVILNGEKETGATLFLMDEKVDHGPILAKSKISAEGGSTSGGKYQISKMSYKELRDKLAELAGELLVKTLPDFLSGKIIPVPQDETAATYTKKFSTEDAFIDSRSLERAEWGLDPDDAFRIERMIRAFDPEPGVWTTKNGKRVKLLEAHIANAEKLVITKIQTEGETPRQI